MGVVKTGEEDEGAKHRIGSLQRKYQKKYTVNMHDEGTPGK